MFNENKEAIMSKIKSDDEKEKRNKGKVGRPPINRNVVIAAETDPTPSYTEKESYKMPYQENTQDPYATHHQDPYATHHQDSYTETYSDNYVYDGIVSMKTVGLIQPIEMHVVVETNTRDYDEAKNFVLKYFFDKNILVYIPEESFEEYLTDTI